MMDQGLNPHLAYDFLLKALVDRSDLTAKQQAHLDSCPRCGRQLEDLKYRYKKLGRMARNTAPQSAHPFRVPVDHSPKRLWHFKPGVAAGLLGVLVFVFTMYWPESSEHMPPPVPLAAYDAQEDAQLMAEVDALVNDALPRAYQQLAALSEPILSEDLIDWIVPTIEEDDVEMEPRA